MKNLSLALLTLVSASAWAGAQRCVLTAGFAPYSEFTVHYDVQSGPAALRNSTARALSFDGHEWSSFAASGARANLNVFVSSKHDGVVVLGFGPLASPFLHVEIEQREIQYQAFSRYFHGERENQGVFSCDPFPPEVASVIARGDRDLISSESN